MSVASANKRKLSFHNEDEVIAEIDRLRAGGYEMLGNWTLAMICRHIDGPVEPPATTKPTPAQATLKEDFIDVILKTGRAPANYEAPPERVPPTTCADTDIEHFKSTLRKLKTYPQSHVALGPFGPVPTAEYRELVLRHTAHHLGFLVPITVATRRAGLRYENEDAVIADIEKLRQGYAQAGSWTFEQICWHLDKAVEARMKPPPYQPDTAEQKQRKAAVPEIIRTGLLPHGIVAPPDFVPPTDAPADAADQCIAALIKLRDFTGEIAPHRFFGKLSDAEARQLNLVHCAHHLSYLVPKA